MTNDEIDAFILARLPTDTFAPLRSLDPPVHGTRLANAACRLRARGLIEGKPRSPGNTTNNRWRRVDGADGLLDRMLAQASLRFEIHPRDITGRYRFQFVIDARQAVWLAMERCRIPYKQIGRWFGYSHATVISGCRTAQDRADRNPAYAEIVRDLEALHPARRREKERLQAEVAAAMIGESATEEMVL